MEKTPMEVTSLSFCYEEKIPVFRNLSFTLKQGMLYSIMGGNGSGKTTILRCLSRILNPCEGTITVGGKTLQNLSRSECARLISAVPQEHTIIFPYRVHNMVIMGRAPYIGTFSMPGKNDSDLAEKAMEEVGITHIADKLYTKISGGERQLVLIARALAQNTPIMILDEPTNHLDFKNQIHILTILKRLVDEKGLLVLIATHDPNHTLHYADEVIILHNGSILTNGSPQEVITKKTIKQVYNVDVDEIRQDNQIRGVIPAQHSLLEGETLL